MRTVCEFPRQNRRKRSPFSRKTVQSIWNTIDFHSIFRVWPRNPGFLWRKVVITTRNDNKEQFPDTSAASQLVSRRHVTRLELKPDFSVLKPPFFSRVSYPLCFFLKYPSCEVSCWPLPRFSSGSRCLRGPPPFRLWFGLMSAWLPGLQLTLRMRRLDGKGCGRAAQTR